MPASHHLDLAEGSRGTHCQAHQPSPSRMKDNQQRLEAGTKTIPPKRALQGNGQLHSEIREASERLSVLVTEATEPHKAKPLPAYWKQ